MNDINSKTLLILSKLFNKNIKMEDDFFLAGGTSLNALIFISEINKTFGTKLLITDLYNNPRISDFIGLFDSNLGLKSKHAEKPLINRLNKSQNKKKSAIFMHDVFGGTDCYLALSKFIENEIEAYGINSTIDSKYPKVFNVESYIEEFIGLENFSNEGSLIISGWSIGGVYAYELARQLENKLSKKIVLTLFDTPFIENEDNYEFSIEKEIDLIKEYMDFPYLANNFSSLSELWDFIIILLKKEPELFDNLVNNITSEFNNVKLSIEHLELEEKIKFYNQFRSIYYSALNYKIEPLKNTKILYFRAQGSDIKSQKWNTCSKDITFFDSSGDHYEMLNHNNVIQISDFLESNLN